MTVQEQTFGVVGIQPNAGFVRQLWLLRCSDVVNLLDPFSFPFSNRIMTVSKSGLLVTAGSLLTKLVPSTRTATFEEPTSLDRAGLIYQPAISLAIPKATAALQQFLYLNALSRWVVFWIDYNGQGWVSGQPDNGLRLVTTPVQGEQHALRLSLSGRLCQPSWRLESTNPELLFPDAAFDFSFDLSFDS